MATMFGDVTGLTTMAVIPEIHIPLGNEEILLMSAFFGNWFGVVSFAN